MSRLPTARTAVLAVALALLPAALPAVAAAHPVDTYQVEPGDTLSEIAQRFRTSVATLVGLNQLSDPDRITAGRTLQVAGPAAAGSGAASGTAGTRGPTGQRHLVRAGDTLAGIAARYGLAVAEVARWNGITSRDVVYAGTSLVLYDPGPQPVAAITCPVPGARFFNDWGFPRAGGRVHLGNDLYAPRGTPVRAPVAGTVTTAEGTIGGRQIWLVDDAGNRWLGSHLDAFGAVGRVRAGQVVGYVGDSGNARGSRPHLHVEYHPAGAGGAVNAYPTLRAAC